MKYLLFIILICLLQACNIKGETFRISQELKDYVFFEKGSIWVYKQENQNKKDTLKLYEKEVNIESAAGQNNDKAENAFMKRYSSYYKNSIVVAIWGEFGDATGTSQTNDYFASQYQVARTLFFSDKPVGYRLTISDGTYTDYVAHYPTYTVAGKEYTDVREYFSVLGFENPTAIDPRLPKRVWYARHVGIIKKELPNGEIWNLIHHEVKQ